MGETNMLELNEKTNKKLPLNSKIDNNTKMEKCKKNMLDVELISLIYKEILKLGGDRNMQLK